MKKTGLGLIDALGVAFIVLKLCNVIEWSWWIVLAPIWGPIAFAIFILWIKAILKSIKEVKRK